MTADWQHAAAYQQFYAAHENGILFYVPAIAIFSIQNGCTIFVSPMQDADEEIIRLYLLGTCMGVILMQRGTFSLHGSAVVIEDRAYAFVGHSGVGKSTLAAAFLSRGYSLMTDDVIAVSPAVGGGTVVIPGYPQQKLWQESLDSLGMESKTYAPLHREYSKFAVPVSHNFCSVEVPLGGVFELNPGQEESLHIEQMKGLSRIPLLHNHTYRNMLIPLLGLEQSHFSASTSLVNQCPIYKVNRPLIGCDALFLADRIINFIMKERVG